MKKITAIAISAILSLSSTAHAEKMLNGAGATFPAPVYSAWAYEYSKVSGIRLNYQSIGSGGGIRQVKERTIHFGASDLPLDSGKLAADKLLQFPALIGGVVPVVNVPGIKPGELKLDTGTLCGIYLGEIRNWSDGRIKGLNPAVNLPNVEITVVHRSDGSGTTAIFTDFLSTVCPSWKEKVGAGTSVSWPAGIGGKGNEGVANYVKQQKNSIGYVEFAYAKQNKLAHTLLKNRSGAFIEPGFESFEDAAATADFDPKKDFYLWLNNAPGKKSWPIAGATFILLPKEKKETNAQVVKFFDWAYKNGAETAKGMVYVPLPKALQEKVRAYWKTNGIY